jgi:hypothetical protein
MSKHSTPMFAERRLQHVVGQAFVDQAKAGFRVKRIKFRCNSDELEPTKPAKGHLDLIRLFAEPNGRSARRGVDLVHYPDLLSALWDILLVDTKCIRPDEDVEVCLSEMLQGHVEAGPDLGLEARAAQCFSRLRIAPWVGQRGEAGRFVEGGVNEINGQLICLCSSMEPQEADLAGP